MPKRFFLLRSSHPRSGGSVTRGVPSGSRVTADKRVGCLAEGEGGGRWGPAVGGGPGAGSVSPARVPPPPPSCPARPRVRGLDAGSRERAPQPSVCPCLTPSDGGREGSVALLAGRCHTGPLCRAVGGWPSAAVCGRTPQQGVGILPSSQESHICRFFVFGKVSFWKRPVSPQSHRGWQCRCGSWGRLGAPVTAPQRCRRRLGFHEQFVSGRRRGSPPPREPAAPSDGCPEPRRQVARGAPGGRRNR